MVGRKGSGKTTRLCRLLSESAEHRVVLIDPPDNIDYGVKVDDLESLVIMLDRQDGKPFHLRYAGISQIQTFDQRDENYNKIEVIVRACLESGNCTLAIDEVDTVCNPYGIAPTLRELLKRGRHDNVNLLWTTRRPQEVSKLLLSQSDEFYLYQMHHPDDIEYFRKFMVFEKGQAEALQVGECIYWQVGGLGATQLDGT